ncbi:MAG: CpsD/CapB family tyrosine-protein kinase [Gemmataceae bacterium]
MNGPHIATSTPAARPPAAAHRPAKHEPEAAGSRILTYLRLHWLMIAFCGTLLAAVASCAAWELLPSKWESYSLLQVSSAPTSLANQNAQQQIRTDFATYVKTTASLVKADFVLNAALRDIKDLPTIKKQSDPIKFLGEELVVAATDGSEVVRITMAGHDPADTKKIVDAVQKAFMAEVVQKEIMEKKIFLQKVEDAKQQIQTLLETKRKPADAVKAVGMEPMPMPFPVPPAGAGLAPLQPVVPAAASDLIAKHDPKSIVGKYAKSLEDCERLPLEIQLGRGHLKELEGKLTALKTAPVDPATMAQVDKDEEIIKQSLRMKQAKTKYEFAKSAGDENSPGVMSLREAWVAHEAKLKEMREEKGRVFEGAKRAVEAKQLAAEWENVKHQVERLEAQLAMAKASLEKSGRQLVDMPVAPTGVVQTGGSIQAGVPYSADTTDLLTTDQIFSRLVQQYHVTKLELESPARVRLLQPASAPMQKDMRKQILATVFAGLMGYGLIALGVVAYETAGRRISSLSDVKGSGPAPIVGVIPCLPGQAMGRDPLKRAAASEAIDKLRAYVTQTWLTRGATSIAVTSPIGDEGKAFAAFGLASSLAQAGYRTLVVDFDLREPALHTYAGVPNIGGVCEVLRGEVEPRVAVQSLPSGLDLMTAGKWSDEARRAAVGGRIEALLTRLKEPYDCVVLHGHALLTAADSVEVARRCDVVLVCAQYRETRMPLLRKATDRVAAMEIPYSGVVYVGSTEHESLC